MSTEVRRPVPTRQQAYLPECNSPIMMGRPYRRGPDRPKANRKQTATYGSDNLLARNLPPCQEPCWGSIPHDATPFCRPYGETCAHGQPGG